MPPATFPSISTTSSTAESSPRSSSSITSTGSGSAHQRDTDGSARIARSFFASPRRPGLSVTLRPTRMGCDPAWSSSAVVTGTRYSRVAGILDDVTLVYLVQHGEKEPLPGDPGLTRRGQEQARLAGQRLRGLEISALYSSPMRRARETAEGIASVTGLTVEFDAR